MTKGEDAARIGQKKACLVCHKEFCGPIERCPDDDSHLIVFDQATLVGLTLADKYEVQELIATGATSVVYLARHNQIGRPTAIKVLKKHFIHDDETKKRFEQEARAISYMTHPNLVTVYDAGVAPSGEPYMVMEYLEGKALSELIASNQRLEIDRAVPIFIQTANALAHAHKKGVIHRDLKPSNIMIVKTDDNPEHVKIVDFGLAKLKNLSGDMQRLTKTGDIFGSPVYMSPEQCTARNIDSRSDIYSLGILMYEALTGKVPFRGGNAIEVIRKQTKDPVPSFRETCPDLILSPDIEVLVMKALRKNPDERYQSMEELREDLEQFVKSPALEKSDWVTSALVNKNNLAIAAMVTVMIIVLMIALAIFAH